MLKTVSGYQLDSLVNQAKTGRNAVGAIWQIRRSGRYRGGDAPVATISIATYSTGFKLVQISFYCTCSCRQWNWWLVTRCITDVSTGKAEDSRSCVGNQ